MQKVFLIVVMVLALAGGVWAAEGTKTLVSPQGTYKITVPEKAPDFLLDTWVQSVMAQGEYPDGTPFAILVDVKDEMVVRSFVIGREDRKSATGNYIPLIVCFCVAYDGTACTDFYFDEEFLRTAEPSGVFTGPVTTEVADEKMKEFANHFIGQKRL